MYIVADIGGTKTRIAGSRDLNTFSEPIIIDTPQNYGDALAVIVSSARQMTGADPIETIAAGLPGVLSPDRRSVQEAHALPDWNGKSFAKDLERELGGDVILENDAALVGLGEAVFGAGIGASIVVYVTVSTGMNGVRVVDGRIDPAAHGFEIGDQYVPCDGTPMFVGDLISGSAIEKKYGKHPKELGKESPVWQELSEYLAYSLNNTVLHWSPHRIVLGGSMFNTIGIPIEATKRSLERLLRKKELMPEMVHSALGDIGGLWGGLAHLKQLRG